VETRSLEVREVIIVTCNCESEQGPAESEVTHRRGQRGICAGLAWEDLGGSREQAPLGLGGRENGPHSRGLWAGSSFQESQVSARAGKEGTLR
jgi:hypothetical protein